MSATGPMLQQIPLIVIGMAHAHDGIEVVVLQRSRTRFEWRLCDKDGTILGKGRASNVLQARSDALRSRSKTPLAENE
jgi:hypothetical protein